MTNAPSQQAAGSPSPGSPRRRWMRYELKVLLVVALIVGGRLAWLSIARGPRLPSVSRETTYATEPLKADGTVDYIRAYSALTGQGVTRENNAAIPLMQLCASLNCESGSSRRGDSCDRLLTALEAPPLPPAEQLRLNEILEAERPADRSSDPVAQYEETCSAPWLPVKVPVAAKVIAANDEALDRVVAASRLPRYHVPRYGPQTDASMGEMELPDMTSLRPAFRMLISRGMMRIGQGQGKQAGEDFMACHRLARLVAQEPLLMCRIMGAAIEITALEGDAALAHYGNLSQEQLAEYRNQLRQLPPLPPLAESVLGERFLLLETMAAVTSGRTNLTDLARESGAKAMQFARAGVFAPFANADEVLRTGNEAFDELARACQLPTSSERKRESDRLRELWQQRAEACTSAANVLSRMAIGTPRQFGRDLGNAMVAIALQSVGQPETSHKRRVLTDLAFELAQYRAQHGNYPASLTDLGPWALSAEWKDYFSLPPEYKRTKEGYLLSSDPADVTITIEMPIPEKKSPPAATPAATY